MKEREEIYQKLDETIQGRLNSVRNDYEFGEITKEEFEETSYRIEQEYTYYLTEMALSSDEELSERMKDIFDFKPIKKR